MNSRSLTIQSTNSGTLQEKDDYTFRLASNGHLLDHRYLSLKEPQPYV